MAIFKDICFIVPRAFPVRRQDILEKQEADIHMAQWLTFNYGILLPKSGNGHFDNLYGRHNSLCCRSSCFAWHCAYSTSPPLPPFFPFLKISGQNNRPVGKIENIFCPRFIQLIVWQNVLMTMITP